LDAHALSDHVLINVQDQCGGLPSLDAGAYLDWGAPSARLINLVSPDALDRFRLLTVVDLNRLTTVPHAVPGEARIELLRGKQGENHH
jgi:hypothetical protein